jgi:phosphotriesterase-related protein
VRVADAVKRLKELKDGGISTIVDLTVTGLGRYVPRIERVNADVDINIIAATGVPISTHTHPATRRGLEQQAIFDEEGVDLSRVVIGHSGDSTDLDYLKEIMSRGSYIGMDRFGIDVLLPFEERVNTVATLCEQGFAGQMVLSHDAACFNDWLPAEALPVMTPNWHYLHITNDVIPALKNRGVTDEQVKQMMVDNPRTIFERARKAY